jgi:hypothetical protein
MRSLKIVLLATVAAAAFSTATQAADAIVMTDVAPAPLAAAAGLDGPYAGLFVLGRTNPGALGVGVDIGVNISSDPVLFGVEGDAYWASSNDWDLQVHGKLGVMASDAAAIYAFSGFGWNSANGSYVPLGVGAEFGVADNMTLAASAEYDWDIGGPGANAVVGKVGVNWHF